MTTKRQAPLAIAYLIIVLSLFMLAMSTARENPMMTLREIADAAGVVYDYAWRVLKGTR